MNVEWMLMTNYVSRVDVNDRPDWMVMTIQCAGVDVKGSYMSRVDNNES